MKAVNTSIVSEHILSTYAGVCVKPFCLYHAFYIIVKHYFKYMYSFYVEISRFFNIRSAGISNVIFVQELSFCVMFSVSDIHDFLFQHEM